MFATSALVRPQCRLGQILVRGRRLRAVIIYVQR
jgi:hypothetical protein